LGPITRVEPAEDLPIVDRGPEGGMAAQLLVAGDPLPIPLASPPPTRRGQDILRCRIPRLSILILQVA